MQNNKNFFANLWLELAIAACIKIHYMFCGCFFPHKGRDGTWTWCFFSPIGNVLKRGVRFFDV